ncbi:hypothetical protein [Actinacidiphila acididurans]|uniref:Uncharacterized protein n=1 Tax=Actinacidiphila acididurans TaxID=2784346 RepID=A0ABS2TPZ0_9ACTN|nr:hypothetical protein [Actinacidiphila acididurans]MBM9505386.1 hypothetical protein [Actinacidiphila acididurans]
MRAADWWSIEVMDAEHTRTSATAWRDAHAQALVESLVTNGAASWKWFEHTWGVVLEVSFTEESAWYAWRTLPGTQAALDAVPDPVRGLLVHRGHGGASGTFVPRVPTVPPAADRAALPEPV